MTEMMVGWERNSNDNTLDIALKVRSSVERVCRIDTRELSSPNDADCSLLSAVVGLVAGQQVLAEHIIFDFDITSDLIEILRELARLLYATSAFYNKVNILSPKLTFTGKPLASYDFSGLVNQSRGVLLLWSGGKDCLYSLRVLREQGYDVTGIYCAANANVEALENSAAARLAAHEELPLLQVGMDLSALGDLPRPSLAAFNVYPHANPVPHGRDLILACTAGLVGRSLGSGVRAGYERDLVGKQVNWKGVPVWRHDIQSRLGVRLLNDLLVASCGVGFASPIDGISEYRILTNLLPDSALWTMIQSCFWGRWCGECTKCVRYGVVQLSLGLSSIEFQKNPIESTAFMDFIADPCARDRPFWEELVVATTDVLGSARWWRDKLEGCSIDVGGMRQALLNS